MASKEIERFLARRFAKTRTVRMDTRLYPEQDAAYEEAAKIEGDADKAAWVRRTLDAAARKVIREDDR